MGLLYAVNTLGAVLGALLTTFFALEMLGIRKTIWIAALLNLLVVLAAASLARELADAAAETAEARRGGASRRRRGARGEPARRPAGWCRSRRRWWASPSC